ncbi:Tetratricopeptide-like helical [Phaffia rhodozyma]|uniref:Tetratricopeptide-like helical n=1 Tax=Phaffia rhodozyma TaxID=264483 RepID=A0A0F7SWD1_PHARH|nr:Tetratricopeptide-like helical [Phaffia rhodozyma]
MEASPVVGNPQPGAPPEGPSPDEQRIMMAQHLEQQRLLNLQKAESLVGQDAEPVNILPLSFHPEHPFILGPPSFPASPASPFVSGPASTQSPYGLSPINADVQPVDLFNTVNLLANVFSKAPDGAIPPPPNPNNVDRGRSVQVAKLKEEGNTKFKAKQYPPSVNTYSLALKVAAERLPWEPSGLVKEEISVLLCNRSAAWAALGEWTHSYADAESVIRLKRPWSKGHFRKAKALLALDQPYLAKEALVLGLSYDPSSTELLAFQQEIDQAISALEDEADDF